MTDKNLELEALERDLDAFAQQAVPGEPDLDAVRRRAWRATWLPLRGVHIPLLVAAAFALDGSWGLAGVAVGLLVLRYVLAVRDERRELAALESEEDLAKHARESATRWVTELRSNVTFFGAGAVVAAVWSPLSDRPGVWLTLAAAIAGLAIYEAVVLLPIASRAYRDWGGTKAHSWLTSVLCVALIPIIVVSLLWALIRFLLSPILGFPDPPGGAKSEDAVDR